MTYRPGDWKAVCDLCGLDYMASELLEDYLGRRVCRKDFETRHPQEFVRPKIEKITPEWTRPTDHSADIAVSGGALVTVSADPDTLIYHFEGTPAPGSELVVLPQANAAGWGNNSYTVVLHNKDDTTTYTLVHTSGNQALIHTHPYGYNILPGTTCRVQNIPSQNIWVRIS
jgi:hypothetical protein